LAWQLEQGSKCGRCGTYSWEWGTDEEPVDAYDADGLLCHGCERLDTEKLRREDQPRLPGVDVVLYRKAAADGP